MDLTLFTEAIGIAATSPSTDPTAAYSLAAFQHDFHDVHARQLHVTAIDDGHDGIPDRSPRDLDHRGGSGAGRVTS